VCAQGEEEDEEEKKTGRRKAIRNGIHWKKNRDKERGKRKLPRFWDGLVGTAGS